MRFNVRTYILGKEFNIKNVEADNEFQAEMKVRKLVADSLKVKSVEQSTLDDDPTVRKLKDIFGMK